MKTLYWLFVITCLAIGIGGALLPEFPSHVAFETGSPYR